MLLYYRSEEQNAFFCFIVGKLGKTAGQSTNRNEKLTEVPMSKALHYNKAVVDG